MSDEDTGLARMWRDIEFISRGGQGAGEMTSSRQRDMQAAAALRVQNVVDAIEAFIAAKIHAQPRPNSVDVIETREHLRDKLAELVEGQVVTTLEIIIAELQRQRDKAGWDSLGWFNAEDPKEAVIDGRVDLVALAEAIDRERVP